MTVRIINADVMDGLSQLADESVNCVVTSPPYYGLRDYGVDGQIGLEATPDDYVARLVDVFREVRRVLRGDGTLWLNLGDSYAGGGYSNNDINGAEWKAAMNGDKRRSRQQDQRNALKGTSIKPKDLMGIPWTVAFALRADGWYLRRDIIWHKEACMPESVRDRCTTAHEYVFMLTKSARYFYDGEAIAEPLAVTNAQRTTASYETFGRGPPVTAGTKAWTPLLPKCEQATTLHATSDPSGRSTRRRSRGLASLRCRLNWRKPV